jgi:hypothetical protein
LRGNSSPGLALAGGVLVAALVALLLIGGGGTGRDGLPSVPPPSSTRLFPADGDVARHPSAPPPRRRAHHHHRSAAGAQYGLGTARTVVLGGA